MAERAERLPPHDIEAEEAVIGALLVDPEAVTEVMATDLKPHDFFREQNAWIYEVASELFKRQESVNQVTVAHELARQKRLEKVGGPAYLSSVVTNLPTSIGAKHYAQIIQADATYRRLISAAGHITRSAYDGEASPEDVKGVLGGAMELIESVAQLVRMGPVHIKEPLGDYMNSEPLHAAGVMTKWPDLTHILGSLQRGDLILIAARPSMGKTSITVDLLTDVVLTQRRNALFFSLEMSKEQVVTRMIACRAGVDSHRVREKVYGDREGKLVNQAIGELADTDTWIQDHAYKIEDIELESRAQSLKRPLDIIVVDYLQLIQGDSKQTRYQVVTEVSARLKRLAKDLRVPLVALSQLNRLTEQRSDPKPVLSDLRESGSLEQDADVVIFLHNPKGKTVDSRPHPVKLLVAKNRMGQVGDVDVTFYPSVSRFLPMRTPTVEDAA